MPPKQSTSGAGSRGGRGRPSGSPGGAAATSKDKITPISTSTTGHTKGAVSRRRENRREGELNDGEMEVDVDARFEREVQGFEGEQEEEDDRERIPPELLTRILYEFFEREGTRITKDANAAVARYVDVFVREAIARAAVEREGGFLEVEDLEKIAPQLLMDL